MKYLLLPVTLLLWYLIAFYSLYYSFSGIAYMYTIHWFWLLIFYPILIGLLSAATNSIPMLFTFYILKKIYSFSLISVILHSFVGLLGIVAGALVLWKLNLGFLDLFKEHWFKSLLLLVPFLAIVGVLIWAMILNPFYARNKIDD